jgi:hypothetical protein
VRLYRLIKSSQSTGRYICLAFGRRNALLDRNGDFFLDLNGDYGDNGS